MGRLLPPPIKLTVAETSQVPDSNKNATYVVHPRAETVEIEDVDEDKKEESFRDNDDIVNSITRSSERRLRRKGTKTNRFNIGHKSVNKYGYHGYIHMQTANTIKDTSLATNDITPMRDEYWQSYIMGGIMTQ